MSVTGKPIRELLWRHGVFKWPYPDRLFYVFVPSRWSYWLWLNDYSWKQVFRYLLLGESAAERKRKK